MSNEQGLQSDVFRSVRRRYGISQTQLARELGHTDRGVVSRAESKSSVSRGMVDALSKIIGVDLWDPLQLERAIRESVAVRQVFDEEDEHPRGVDMVGGSVHILSYLEREIARKDQELVVLRKELAAERVLRMELEKLAMEREGKLRDELRDMALDIAKMQAELEIDGKIEKRLVDRGLADSGGADFVGILQALSGPLSELAKGWMGNGGGGSGVGLGGALNRYGAGLAPPPQQQQQPQQQGVVRQVSPVEV